jgi:hypothetical protein
VGVMPWARRPGGLRDGVPGRGHRCNSIRRRASGGGAPGRREILPPRAVPGRICSNEKYRGRVLGRAASSATSP